MLGLILLILAAALLGRQLWQMQPARQPNSRSSLRLSQAEQYAARLYREKKYHAAEKAYLEVLKVDHRNANAYVHLGMIYSIQHNFSDAVESFELAARFNPSASSYHHLAAAYFENKNYIKAIAAYEKASVFEPSAAVYVGLARAFDKLANGRKAIEAQEQAARLEPTARQLTALATLYSSYGHKEQASEVRRRLRTGDLMVTEANNQPVVKAGSRG